MAASRDSEPVHKVVVEKNLAMRTRDGVALKADVYRPDASGKFPVLVMRTPYDKGAAMVLSGIDWWATSHVFKAGHLIPRKASSAFRA